MDSIFIHCKNTLSTAKGCAYSHFLVVKQSSNKISAVLPSGINLNPLFKAFLWLHASHSDLRLIVSDFTLIKVKYFNLRQVVRSVVFTTATTVKSMVQLPSKPRCCVKVLYDNCPSLTESGKQQNSSGKHGNKSNLPSS